MVTLLMLALPSVAGTQEPRREIALELSVGSAWNMPLPVTVDRPDGRTRFTARYETRPFDDAPYYSLRLRFAREAKTGIEAELLHHKLYLTNPQPPIERLEVSHGYNLAMANIVHPSRAWHFRLGVGAVVTHAEGRIAGREIDAGYQVAGATLQIAAGRRYSLSRGATSFSLGPETKLTASWARAHAATGRILLPNIAIHVLGGLGLRKRL